MRVRPHAWLVVTALVVLVAVLVVVVVLGPLWLYPPLSSAGLAGVADPKARIELQQAQSQLQNNARGLLLQTIGGIVVLAGLAATWRQVMVARDGQITDRIGRAVEQLGSDKVDVRVGGVYALGRVANNSGPDRPTVQYMLGAFVRGHAPWDGRAPGGDVDRDLPWMYVRAPDVQAAMNVLGRRPRARGAWRLYLSRVDLRSTALDGVRLTEVIMRRATLARAELSGARLDGGDLKGTDLRQASLAGASLTGAVLVEACLRDADLHQADLRGADLRGADLRARRLESALLTGARADDSTVWPAGFDAGRLRDLGVDVNS
ncbi:pentapeptide repeat-containing protein [Dactylosporangium sp. NPDC049140]|uniref:pentapeptide repeat-containing protein n=1 Tax=Dactylosporangium sp. NPDC049140 TaxID=3155647 RepID=UPI0033E0349E